MNKLQRFVTGNKKQLTIGLVFTVAAFGLYGYYKLKKAYENYISDSDY